MATTTTTGSPLPALFLGEGLFNIFGGLFFIFMPSAFLDATTPAIVSSATSESVHPTSSIQLVQLFGSVMFSLGTPFLLASRNTPKAIGSRSLVYWTMVTIEATSTALMFSQGMSGSDLSLATATGLSPKFCLAAAGCIGFFGLGRLYVLLAKPEWFEVPKDIKQKSQ